MLGGEEGVPADRGGGRGHRGEARGAKGTRICTRNQKPEPGTRNKRWRYPCTLNSFSRGAGAGDVHERLQLHRHFQPRLRLVPYTLYPFPYTLYPIPYTLYPIPYTLYPIPYTLYPTPDTLYPIPYTLYPIPNTRLLNRLLNPLSQTPVSLTNTRLLHT